MTNEQIKKPTKKELAAIIAGLKKTDPNFATNNHQTQLDKHTEKRIKEADKNRA